MTTKRALVVVGTVLFLLGLTFIVPARYVGLEPKAKKHDPLVLKTSYELAGLQGDKDKNGIPDWKDVINETMSTTTKASIGTKTLDPEVKKRLDDPNNLTSSFSKNIYIASAYAEKKGTLTEKQKDELAATVLEAEKSKITSKIYELDELTLQKDETTASIKEYGNALGTVYKKALASNATENDVAILKAYIETKDSKVLAGLVVKKNVISTALATLVSMRVPISASPYHLVMVNRISEYVTVLDNIAKVDTDPIRATLAFNAYVDTMRTLHASFSALQNYFLIQGIVFSKDEAGFSLTSEYTK